MSPGLTSDMQQEAANIPEAISTTKDGNDGHLHHTGVMDDLQLVATSANGVHSLETWVVL